MRSQSILVVGMVLGIFGVVQQEAVANVTFDDGGVHNIDYEINDLVDVDYQSPGMKTTVNWLDGGILLYPYWLSGYGDSTINIFDGTVIRYLNAWENCQVTIYDGSVYSLSTLDNSKAKIFGGSTDIHLNPQDKSEVEIYGGSISSGWTAYENSQVTIFGGSIGKEMRAGYSDFCSSTITLIGSDFAINGMSVGYGEYDTGGWSVVGGTLTGTLANGDYLDSRFYIRGDSRIVLAPIPAPGALLLGSIGVGIVGWLRRIGSGI